ncbi:MAG: ABC transporter substrate-binding protein [Marinifilaceae bacterium]
MIRLIVCGLVLLGLTACGGSGSGKRANQEEKGVSKGFDFNARVTYAKGFSIARRENYKEITVYNPWKNDDVLRKYALIPRGEDVPEGLDPKITVVKVPVKTVAIFSNTQIGPLLKLGLEDKLVGMTRAGKVYDKGLLERVEKGDIAQLGGAHNKNINVEKIVELDPELILLSAFNEVKAGETRLDEIGFKLAYALNWMEATPLGRAEWMKFIAAFFNKGAEADSIFNRIEDNYNQLRQIARNVKTKPTVLLGWSYRGTWYMPGGQNYMVSYLRDAGANYFLFDDDTRGNIPMSVETVLDQCMHADLWIYPGICKNMDDVENGGEVFTQFDAYRKGEVYNIYKRMTSQGGSDWWESGCVSPDVVLKDFIKILHPELLPQDTTYFLSKLKWADKAIQIH